MSEKPAHRLTNIHGSAHSNTICYRKVEEENIVAIYAEDSRETTLENILAAMPYMDEDMRQLAAAAVNKLQAMTDSEFSEREFILTDEE